MSSPSCPWASRMVTAFMPRSVTDPTVESNGCLNSSLPQSEQDCVPQPSNGPPAGKEAVLRWEYRDEWLDDGVLTDAGKALIEQRFRGPGGQPARLRPLGRSQAPAPGSIQARTIG